MGAPIAIKGIRDGLLITVPEMDWASALPDLLGAVDERGEFFRGARIALQVGEQALGAADLGRLVQDLSQRDIHLWAVLSDSDTTKEAAANLGLATELSRPAVEEKPHDVELEADAAVLVQRTLRSGHRIHHPGHVVVIGDVNPGAEIVAGGNVVVWGRLRGVVHAGATGNLEAVVCALDLSPTQLRIADQIAVSPERKGRARPEIACIREGQLVAEEWSDERHR